MEWSAPFCFLLYSLMAIVVVIVPIAVAVPAMAILIPPAAVLVPAAFARFVQFIPRTVGLPAVPAVMFRGFVESVVRPGNASLATIIALRGRPGRSRKCQHPQKRRGQQQCPSWKLLLSRVKHDHSSILQVSPRLGWGPAP